MPSRKSAMVQIATLTALLAALAGSAAAQDNTIKPKPKPEKAKAVSTWTDPATNLMWTNRDIDVDQDWSMATELCQSLRWNGRADWRLPTINELEGIFDVETPTRTLVFEGLQFKYHIKGGITLTGREWSSTLARMARDRPAALPPAGAMTFNFSLGEQVAFPLSAAEGNRTLCVRRSGE